MYLYNDAKLAEADVWSSSDETEMLQNDSGVFWVDMAGFICAQAPFLWKIACYKYIEIVL